jgi:ribonuclease E
MSTQLLIDGSHKDQVQVALVEDQKIKDFEFESKSKRHLKGNIYLGKVTRIEASLQAAFIDIGFEKNGFLAFGEIHPNYFQIPVADKEALIKAEAQAEIDHDSDDDSDSSNDDDDDNDSTNDDESYNNTEIEANGQENQEKSEENLEIKTLTDQESIDNENEEPVITESKRKKTSYKRKKNSKPSFRRKLFRSYKIQEVIKTGQLILVQVVKEERGNKGAAVTSYISLAGKYSVLMPNSTKTKGISRKISTSDDRNKLKKIIEDLKVPDEMGLIIRTAGLNKTKNEIKRDYASLYKLWNNIIEETKKSIAPALIHEEGNLLRRVIRDIYTKEMKEVLVEGTDAYKETKKHMSQIMPSCSKFVKSYKNKTPLFSKYDVNREISKMFESEVKLKSGGYLVINPTEALVAIDVNSGSAIKERNIEKTALKTNLEAAEEIGKQIKIRDLSGLIVIDFIDMYEMRNNRNVEKKLKDSVRLDRARIQVGRISQFGLLEMSRQRLRQSFIEWRSTLSINSSALKVIYLLKSYLNSLDKKIDKIDVELNASVKDFINENLADDIDLFKKSGLEIILKENKNFENEEIKINKNNLKPNKKKIQSKKKSKSPDTEINKQKKKKKSKVTKKDSKKVKISDRIKTNNAEEKIKIEDKGFDEVAPLKEIVNKKKGWWSK